MNIETKIENYLSDESKTYQDWYTGLNQEEHTTKVGVIPDADELKILFEQWFNQYKNALKKICDGYCQVRQKLQNKKPLLIAALADLLTTALGGIPVNVAATATILITEGFLDSLCN
jgi:hypothetical protein